MVKERRKKNEDKTFNLAGCASLPDNSDREASYVIAEGENTSLGRSFSALVEMHPDQSGIILLGNGLDAFVGRAVLAGLVEKSIDIQYYMFHQETVGRLLIREFPDIFSIYATHNLMSVRLSRVIIFALPCPFCVGSVPILHKATG